MDINFLDFIKPELMVLVPVLYVVGIGIKHTKLDNKFIPLLLGLFSVILASLYVLATSYLAGYQDALMAVFTAVTQGLLCAGFSVYVNQLVKQNKKSEKK